MYIGHSAGVHGRPSSGQGKHHLMPEEDGQALTCAILVDQGDHMDDGMMQPEEKVDPMTLLLAKLEAMEKRMEQLTNDNATIKTQNAQLVRTNVNLMQQAPAPVEPVPDVRDIAFESLKNELLRGKVKR